MTPPHPPTTPKPPKPRGFQVIAPARRREIARLGGLASQASGHGHRFAAGSTHAREAGSAGGRAAAKRRVKASA